MISLVFSRYWQVAITLTCNLGIITNAVTPPDSQLQTLGDTRIQWRETTRLLRVTSVPSGKSHEEGTTRITFRSGPEKGRTETFPWYIDNPIQEAKCGEDVVFIRTAGYFKHPGWTTSFATSLVFYSNGRLLRTVSSDELSVMSCGSGKGPFGLFLEKQPQKHTHSLAGDPFKVRTLAGYSIQFDCHGRATQVIDSYADFLATPGALKVKEWVAQNVSKRKCLVALICSSYPSDIYPGTSKTSPGAEIPAYFVSMIPLRSLDALTPNFNAESYLRESRSANTKAPQIGEVWLLGVEESWIRHKIRIEDLRPLFPPDPVKKVFH